MDFKEFLVEENHIVLEKEIFVTKRFGQDVLWKIKGVSEKNFRENFQNDVDYWCNLCVASLVYPDLDSDILLESYDVNSPFQLLKEILFPPEYQRLISEVKKINGFNERKQYWKEFSKNAITKGNENCDYAFYALRNFGITPSQWADMSLPERMFICAGIDVEIEARKEKDN